MPQSLANQLLQQHLTPALSSLLLLKHNMQCARPLISPYAQATLASPAVGHPGQVLPAAVSFPQYHS